MNPPALLTCPPQTPGQTDARDASGRIDAIPKGVADDFARALSERDAIIQRLRLALAQRESQLALALALALLVVSNEN